ncbi:MAG: hypothetical protein ACRDFB_09115 [Rhabdochlamydiaceae bacterium]
MKSPKQRLSIKRIPSRLVKKFQSLGVVAKTASSVVLILALIIIGALSSYGYDSLTASKLNTAPPTAGRPETSQSSSAFTKSLSSSTSKTSNTKSTPTTSTDDPDCTTTVLQYGITYQNVDYLAQGQTEVSSHGVKGYTIHCPAHDGSKAVTQTMTPTNEIDIVGTGKDAAAEQQQAAQAATCQSLEQQAETDQQTIQSDETNYHNLEIELGSIGAGGSSEEQYLEQQAASKLAQDQASYNKVLDEISSDNCG